MAEVFEAEIVGELGFSRKVAIKRMLSHAAADPRAASRFLDEAQIASRLHHANVVAVTDVGLLDDLPFHVLELVDGMNAHELQQRSGGTLPVEIALIIAADVAHALDHAHSAADAAGIPLGVVHRDVKPSNILVSWGGDVKLSDFGIAFAHERGARTETGFVAGTMGFIAPEQRLQGTVDGRADVFALGLTVCALITGSTPLRDISVEMELLEGRPIPLPDEIPHDVRLVLARALAPSRLDRPTAVELASALGAVLSPRLMRDPRSVLRDFLQRLQPRRASGGALDQLLGIEVESEGSAGSAGAFRRFRTVAVARTDAPTVQAPSADAAEGSPPPPPTVHHRPRSEPSAAPSAELVPARPRRRGALAVIALAVLAIGGGGAWWATQRSSAASAPPPTATDLVATAGHDAGTPAASSPAPLAVDASVVATAPAVDAGSSERSASVRSDKRRPSTAGSARPPVAPITSVAATTVERGWLQVVGEPLVGAKVVVDGAYTAYVPNAVEVPLGDHRVVIEQRDGTTLPAKQVKVTSFHTMKRPLRLTW